MDILFEDNISIAPIIYEAMEEQQQIMIEMASMLYNFQKTDNIEVVQEGFMDILEKVKEAVLNMIHKIRETIRNFIARLNSRSSSYDKVVKMCTEGGIDFDSVKPFTITGFNFKVGSDTRPDVRVVDKLYYEHNAGLVNFKQLTSDAVQKMCEEMTSSETLGKKRAELLGTSGSISQDDLKEAAFKFYRDGKSEAFDITISGANVRDVVKKQKSIKGEHKETIEEQKSINALLNRMETTFKTDLPNAVKKYKDFSRATVTYIGGSSGVDAGVQDTHNEFDAMNQGRITNISNVNNYINARYKQTVAIATAVTTVYTARIAALESKMRQDEHIIREAMKQSGRAVDESMRIFDKHNSYPMTPNMDWACVTEGCNLIGGEIYG